MPFLENVTRGRRVPRERLLEVAGHYHHFGGISPINEQCRALLRELRLPVPVYWGNRNWHPFLADTLRQMIAGGCRNALALPTSAFSSYSGCWQYHEDVARARAEAGPNAPEITIIRRFFNHPGFIEPMVEAARTALEPHPRAKLIFTAHSIPQAMAAGCDYALQLHEAARLIAGGAKADAYRVAYQSRSGPPEVPWLEPDILDVLREEKASGTEAVAVHPIGFISDHMEVLYDLDFEASQLASELGLRFTRAATAGTHPRFVRMISELVAEYTDGAPALFIGNLPPKRCREGCCPAPAPPASRG
jgi:ferrochelatase